MTFNFTVKEFIIGNGTSTPTLQFYKHGFELNGGGESPSWQDIILSGTTALTLTNAIADGLNYLKLFGGTELLSEQYLDTVTLSGGCEQRNLPSEYVQNQFIWMKENSYLLTNIIPTYDGHYELDFQTTTVYTNAAAYLGGRAGQSPAGLIFSHGSGNVLVTDAFGQRYSITYRAEDNTHYKYVFNNKVFTLYKNGEVVETHTFTSSTNSGAALAIKAINMGDSIDFAGEGFYFYGFKAWNNQGQLIADYIPATKLQGLVTGIYDKITNTFLTATSGEWSSGPALQPTPDTPMDIVCNNGVLKVSPNLFDINNVTIQADTSIGSDGSLIPNVATKVCMTYLSVKPNTTYTISGDILGSDTAFFRLAQYKADKTFLGRSADSTGQRSSYTFTTDADTYFVRFHCITEANLNTYQLEQGSVATSYMPYGQIYVDGTQEVVTDGVGNTASAEMLLAVGDYKDTQEVLNGSVTRNIGVMVLDGTEDWSLTGTSFRFDGNISFAQPNTCLCTHFKGWLSTDSINDMPNLSIKAGHPTNTYRVYARYGKFTTVEQLKSWLADQYANGTPIIIVYPLATATTSTVTGQFLSKSPVTQTAGSISNLPIAITESEKTVPTPQQPLPINCNNGVLKARHQSGLPLGYTLLDYIESTGTQYIDTGYKPNANTAISIKYYPAVLSTFMCLYGTQDTVSANRFYGLVSSTQFRIQINSNAGQTPNYWGINANGTLVPNNNGTFAQTQGIVTLGIDNKNKVISVKSDEYTGNISASGTVLGDNLNCHYNMLLLSRSTTGTTGNNFQGRLYSFAVKENDTLIQNLIPAKRNSDNVLGMYDLVSGQFLINQGTGTFVAGNTVSDPIEIYTDGTTETVDVHGKNLWTEDNFFGKGYYNNGVWTPNDVWRAYNVAVKPNTDYTMFQVDTSEWGGFVTFWNGDSYLTQINIGNTSERHMTTPADCNKVTIVTSGTAIRTVQLEQGSSATTYEPYFNGGSATAENLFKVGTHQDVQSVIDGGVTRKVGVKVLDGTENWDYQIQVPDVMTIKSVVFPDDFYSNPNNNVGYCNYYTVVATSTSLSSVLTSGQMGWNTIGNIMFKWTKSGASGVSSFKQWLAQQYNAGTPVIIVYPLATATTETVTGQPMTIQEGTNIVEITQASIDNLELEVSYKATV